MSNAKNLRLDKVGIQQSHGGFIEDVYFSFLDENMDRVSYCVETLANDSAANIGKRLKAVGEVLLQLSNSEPSAAQEAPKASANTNTAESKQNAPQPELSAFPTSGRTTNDVLLSNSTGMSLRDYFAIRGATFALGDKKFDCASPEMISNALAQAAAHGYSFADAMLRARETK